MSGTAVVVVNYGSSDLIERHVSGLRSSGHDETLSIVVVDNHSSVAERERITDLTVRHGWTLIAPPDNRGFGAGSNAGMLAAFEAGADVVVLVNPDAVVSAELIRELAAGVRREPLTMMSPVICDSAGNVVFEGVELDVRTGNMRRARSPLTPDGWRRWGPDADGRTEPWLTGACLAISRQMYERTGGFDERFFLYWEDVDLSVRVRRAGGSLAVRTDLRAVHDEGGTQGGRTGRAKSNLYYRYNCRNRLMFAALHLTRREQWQWLWSTPAASAEILLRGGRRQLLSSLSPVRAALAGSLAGAAIGLRSLLWSRPTPPRPGSVDRAPENAAETPLHVVVAIPTFRRPATLARMIELAGGQAADVNRTLQDRFRVELLVIDNDPAASAREAAARPAEVPVRYLVETTPGVTAVRNRALAEANADLLLFADDDERPTDHWLRRMLLAQSASGAAGVAGPVVPEFDGPPPAWMVAGQIFVQPDPPPTGTPVAAAGAGNLLLDLRQTGDLRFAPEMGLAGGEDTLFTTAMTRRGLRLVRCNEAVLMNPIPASRITRRFVARRALSHGNTGGLIAADFPGGGPRPRAQMLVGARGALRMTTGASMWASGLLTGSLRWQARGMRRTAAGAGMMLAAGGWVYLEYARPTTVDGRRPRRLVRWTSLRGEVDRLLQSDPATDSGREQALVALQSFPGGRPLGNPYRVLLEEALRATDGLEVLTFSWRTALTGRYDLLHIHWPETWLSAPTPVRRAVKRSLFLLLLFRLRWRRTTVVATVHNLELPRDAVGMDRRLLGALHRRAGLRVRLNESTPERDGKRYETILHGHYRSWYPLDAGTATIAGRVLFFGLVRRYKGVDGLIEAFRGTATTLTDASLVVLGRPSNADLAARLQGMAHGDPRIHLRLHFVPDPDLVTEILQSELVVLPYPEMHNSAAVITALSLDRPVLVPDSEVNRSLREEVGGPWVQLYEGRLGPADLTRALQSVRSGRSTRPDLRRREWDDVGRRHLQAYRRAVGPVRTGNVGRHGRTPSAEPV